MDLSDYIESHISSEPEYLHQLDRTSHLRMVHGRMCAGHWQGRLLKMLTEMIAPRRILELGTFTGYSTLCMAEGSPRDARIDTIEIYDENEEFLKGVFESTPHGEKVNLIIGDAAEILPAMEEHSYDMIFIDADKREYPRYLSEAKRILRPGGYILADNTLWDGHVADSGYHDAQTEGVRKFNDMVRDDGELEKVIIPLRDGMTLIRKIPSFG